MPSELYPHGQIHVEAILMCREVIREASGTLSFFRVFGGVNVRAGRSESYITTDGAIVVVVSGPADYDFDASPLWLRITPTADRKQSVKSMFVSGPAASDMVGLIVWTELSRIALWPGSDYEISVEVEDHQPLATTLLQIRLTPGEASSPPQDATYIRWDQRAPHSRSPEQM